MSSLSNHLNDEIQPTNDDLNNNTTSAELTTDQVTFRCNLCNMRSFTTYCGLNQHLRSCIKKSRDTDANILASQPCSSRTNVTNGRENSVDIERRFLWGKRNVQRKKCPYSEFFWSECEKIRTRKTPNTDIFQAVMVKKWQKW